ncbi:MAG: hypothetical protein H6716_28710 [Polyangiaceae bacterium]|nr:hypothetical protein [Polyangiaceae bacterium]
MLFEDRENFFLPFGAGEWRHRREIQVTDLTCDQPFIPTGACKTDGSSTGGGGGGGETLVQTTTTAKRCGPDITAWLATELQVIGQIAKAQNPDQGIIEATKHLAENGNSMWHGKPGGTAFKLAKAGIKGECPVACPDSVTVCGICMNTSEIGNMALGAMGYGAGFGSAEDLLLATRAGVATLNFGKAARRGAKIARRLILPIPGTPPIPPKEKEDEYIDGPDQEQDKNAIKAGYNAAKKGMDFFASIMGDWLCETVASAGNLQAPEVVDCEACVKGVGNVMPRRADGVRPASTGNHTYATRDKDGNFTGYQVPATVSDAPPKKESGGK